MKDFKVRGKQRRVGTVIIPSAEAMSAFHAMGMFHDVFKDLPAAPASVDYITPALAALNTMLGNGPDSTLPAGQGPVGDCILAEDLHLAAMRACNAGDPWVPTTAQALAAYAAVTGFVIGQPNTDQGTDPLALITYRLAGNPYPDGSTLLAAIAIDASNVDSRRKAIWLGCGVFQWASLPDAWESEEDGGDTWDVAGDPVPQNGHGFAAGAYSGSTESLIEWAEESPPILLTNAAAAKYLVPSAGGGCVALIGSNMFSKKTGLCPAGFDQPTIMNYIASLGTPVQGAVPSSPPSQPPPSQPPPSRRS